MATELFTPQSVNPTVQSSRIIYTPSAFARFSLLHLQEVGTLRAIAPHVSGRTNLTCSGFNAADPDAIIAWNSRMNDLVIMDEIAEAIRNQVPVNKLGKIYEKVLAIYRKT